MNLIRCPRCKCPTLEEHVGLSCHAHNNQIIGRKQSGGESLHRMPLVHGRPVQELDQEVKDGT